MSTATDELFDLIHSLSKTERRYFKVSFTHTSLGDTAKYLQVFDVLASMETFDKNELVMKVNNELVGKYYSKTKAFLTDAILDAMGLYVKGGGNYQAEIHTEITAIRFLIKKGVTQTAKSKIAKLKRLCLENENIHALLEVLTLETSLYIGDWNKLEPTHVEYEKQLALLQRDSALYKLHYTVIELERENSVRPNESQRKEIHSCLEQLSTFNDVDLLLDSRRRLVSTVSICYHMLNEHLKACEILMSYFSEYTTFPQQYQSSRSIQLSHLLQNALSFAYRSGNIESYNRIADLIQQNFESMKFVERIRFEIQLIILFHRIALSRDYKHFEESVSYVEKEEKRIKEIVPVRRIDLQFNIALGYLKTGNYAKSIVWLEKLHQDPDLVHYGATMRHAALLEILLHWKLQNTTLVLSRIRAFQRKLSRTPDLGAFEIILLRFMNSVVNKEKYKNFDKELAVFKREVATLDNKTYAGIVRHYNDLITFLET